MGSWDSMGYLGIYLKSPGIKGYMLSPRQNSGQAVWVEKHLG